MRFPWQVSILPVRKLGRADYPAAAELMRHAPVETVLMRGWLDQPAPSGQYFLGYFADNGDLQAVCWNGANIIPWGFDAESLAELAGYLAGSRIFANSLVGAAQQVMPLWELLRPTFAAPREVRAHQLSMLWQGERASVVAADSRVRAATRSEFGLVFPASVAMFVEEVGYDPSAKGNFYAKRVRSLIEQGWTFVRMGYDYYGRQRVEFKADIGAFAGGVAQVQGVWVAPDLRGRGLAAPAMVAVAQQMRQRFGVSVHLYVNDFNVPAVRTYEKAGFTVVGEYATVLL
ncbi:MAG: GNAT family N-acetyltransferase [Actinomycetaceae bacterium]|nr:GNAT family N-acetyltransferase [Actinomycetaceae bacterium]MDY5854851.1 GNAT family N-acetyltransferase [Arcanobacterium sp.]